MPYTIIYHPDIPRRDLPRITLNVQSRIADALAVRLREKPEKYGQPLCGTLGGYWKLRVGDYRVVFKIVGDEVWVLAIMHRRQVYEDVVRRIGWQPAQALLGGAERNRRKLARNRRVARGMAPAD